MGKNWARSDLIGQKFGRLLVTGITDKRSKAGYIFWLCSCECGNQIDVRTNGLTMGNTRSCGCLKKEQSKRPRLDLRKQAYEWLYNIFVRKAKQEGWRVGLTYEDFLKFTEESSCHYCWNVLVWLQHSKSGRTEAYNLDRKNSTLGYETGNVVACCKRCNRAKSNAFTYEEWYAMTAVFRTPEEA